MTDTNKTYKRKILDHLIEHGEADTRQLADMLGVLVGGFSCQLKGLLDDGYIRLVGTVGKGPTPRRVWALGPTPAENYHPAGRRRKGFRRSDTVKAKPRKIPDRERARRIAEYQAIQGKARAAARGTPVLPNDLMREQLTRDVEAYLAVGGEIEDIGSYRDDVPVRTIVHRFAGGVL